VPATTGWIRGSQIDSDPGRRPVTVWLGGVTSSHEYGGIDLRVPSSAQVSPLKFGSPSVWSQ
jgi:hypothetical protein